MFENFPYSNFHELNLDWILKTIKEIEDELTQIINQGKPEALKTVHIKRDTAINDNVIATNVIYDIDPDATLTFNGDFVAPRKSIFTGGGSVIFTKTSVVFPEWFGAVRDGLTDCTTAINHAIQSLAGGGCVSLASGKWHEYVQKFENYYLCNNTINMSMDNVALVGCAPKAMILSTAMTGIEVKRAVSSSLYGYAQDCDIYNVNIKSTLTNQEAIGINVNGAIRGHLQTLEIRNFGKGVCIKNSVNEFFNNVIVTPNPNVALAFGFLAETDNNNTGPFDNDSIYFNNCMVTGGANTVAFSAKGSRISDLFFNHCEAGGCYTGIEIAYAEDRTPVKETELDIHITSCILDGCHYAGISLTGNSNFNGNLSISDCFCSSATTGSAYGIVMNIGLNVAISNCTFVGKNSAGYVGIAMSNCHCGTINGCTFLGFLKGISMNTSCSEITISANLFLARWHNADAAIYLTTCVNNTINANVISSVSVTLTKGIVVDASPNKLFGNISNSANNIAAGNIVDGTTL